MCHPRLPHSRLKHHPCVDSQTSTLRFFLQIIQYRISVIFKWPKYTASRQSMAERSFRTTVSTFGTVHHASAGSSGELSGAESVGLCGMVVKTIQCAGTGPAQPRPRAIPPASTSVVTLEEILRSERPWPAKSARRGAAAPQPKAA